MLAVIKAITHAKQGARLWSRLMSGKIEYHIEVGRGVNPLPITQLPDIYKKNEEILLLAPII